MSRLLKFWIATTITWAIIVVAFFAIATGGSSAGMSPDMTNFAIAAIAIPSGFLFIVGALFRWALK